MCGMHVHVLEKTSKRVRGYSLWPTLALPSPFLTRPVSLPLRAWRAGLQAHSDLTSSRWEDRPGIPSASGCGAPWEGRGRGEVGLFLCKSSCQKGLRNRFVRLGWMKLLSISHSSVWINNYHRPAGTPPKTRAGPALPDQDLWAP